MAHSPVSCMHGVISRKDIKESVLVNAPYEEVVNKINGLDHNERISVYVICQNVKGWYSGARSLATYLSILPNMANYTEDPFVFSDEKDDWYIANYEPQEWMDILCDGYDYVAIYDVDDYFTNRYSSLFTDDIKANCLYQVDKEKKVLKLVE